MFGRKPGLGPRVQDLDRRQQDAERLLKSLPGPTTPLTAPPKLPQPLVQYVFPERLHSLLVTRNRMILEIPANHPREPPRDVPNRLVQTLSQLLPDIVQLGGHSFAHRLSMHRDVPGPAAPPTDGSETQKIKGLRLPFPTLLPAFRGIAPKFHQACLVRV